MKLLKRLLAATVAFSMMACLTIAAFASENLVSEAGATDDLTPIMGESTVTVGQMANFYMDNADYPEFYADTEASNIYEFCEIYKEECEAEGLRVEVAFSQSMLETGFLQFRNDVKIEQFNFAGLEATGTGENPGGNSYSSVREGIRAHIQRLKAYAVKGTTAESFKYPCIDAHKFTGWWLETMVGSAPYVEWLGKAQNPTGIGWATDPYYGSKIINVMGRLTKASTYTTWYQGTDYAAVYDPDYYLQHNPDVARAFGTDGEKVIQHFINNGMREGRQGSADFSVQSYRNQYADLRRAYGKNLKSYYLHYIKYGKKEGRKGIGCSSLQNAITVYNGIDYKDVYNFNDYIARYSDIARLYSGDDMGALQHFVTFGMKEGRQGSDSFSVQSYRNQYADLRRAFGNNLKSYYLHYINNGKKEGRKTTGCTSLQNAITIYNGVDYKNVYNYDFYISKYPDVKRLYGGDDSAALQYFVNTGMKAGHQGIETFDVNSYKNQYADLRRAFGSDLKSYYLHYINYGWKEGRAGTGCTTVLGATSVHNGVDYSAVYDYNYYVSANADVKQAFGNDDVAVLNHFVTFGMKEGRRASENFNVQAYRNRYMDLQNAFENDMKAYYLHYMNYGRAEGRNGK